MSYLTKTEIEELRQEVRKERERGYSSYDNPVRQHVMRWASSKDPKDLSRAMKEVERNVKRRSLHRKMRLEEEDTDA